MLLLEKEVELVRDVFEAMTPAESPIGDIPSYLPMSALGMFPVVLGPELPKDPA
jgi:hypothetical protein